MAVRPTSRNASLVRDVTPGYELEQLLEGLSTAVTVEDEGEILLKGNSKGLASEAPRGGSLQLWRERVIVAAMVGFLKAPLVMALVMLLCAVMAVRLAGGTRAVHMAKEESYESDGDGSSSRGSTRVLALDKGDGSQAPRIAQGLPYERARGGEKPPTDAMEGQVWPGGGWVPWGVRDVWQLEGNAAGSSQGPWDGGGTEGVGEPAALVHRGRWQDLWATC